MRAVAHHFTPTKVLIQAIALTASLIPAVAQAGFSAPINISQATEDTVTPRVAIDSEGDALVVWQGFDGTNRRIQARSRSTAGLLGPIQTISDAGQDAISPQVAVDSDGDALIVWRRFDGMHHRVQARARRASGRLDPVQTLSAAGQEAYTPAIAMDASGRALTVWTRSDGSKLRIEMRVRTATGAFGPVQILSNAAHNSGNPIIAMNGNGDGVIVWRGADDTSSRVYARARSAAGKLGSVQGVSDPAQAAYFIPSAAMDANGNTVIAWVVFDGTTFAAQARARSAAGAFGQVQPLSPPGKQADGIQVAMSPGGRALVVWQLYDGQFQRIQGRTYAAGKFSRVIDVSPTGQKAYIPQAALDATGDAVITWGRLDTPRYRVEARARSAAGALGPITGLSNVTKYAGEPQAAIAPDGRALVVWTIGENDSDWIQAATGP